MTQKEISLSKQKKKWKRKEEIRKDKKENPMMMKKKNKEVMTYHIKEVEVVLDNQRYKK